MIAPLATLLFHIGNVFFTASLYLHEHFQTPWWRRTNASIKLVEDRLEEMEALEAMGEAVVGDEC